MPCDHPGLRERVCGAAAPFRAALDAAAAQVRALLSESAGADGPAAPTAELGQFAEGRIDPLRFASHVRHAALPQPGEDRAAVASALAALDGLVASGDALFELVVEPGGSLRDAVARGLAEIGRAYAASRQVELARRHRDAPPAAHPFAAWSRIERRISPPLLVHVRGEDLHAASLAEFLDGGVKLVLCVEGPAAPAPLVRLVTPGTYVLQATDEAEVARLLAAEGPGVAAVLPAGCAEFRHVPGEEDLVSRLTVGKVPEGPPTRAIGGISAAQQQEELAQLRTLLVSTDPARPAAASDSARRPADADRLAAWLLGRTELPEALA